MPDVRQALHGGATDVDRRSPGPQRDEVPLAPGGGVEQAQAHMFQSTDRWYRPGPAPAAQAGGQQQGGGDRGQALAAAGEAEAVGGGAGHRDRSAGRGGQHLLRLRAAGADPRGVADDLHGGVAQRPALPGDQLAHVGQQRDAAGVRPLRAAGAEDRADVAEPGRGQQGVAQRVRGHVAVGVTGAAVHAVPAQPGHPAHPAGLDRVHIRPEPTLIPILSRAPTQHLGQLEIPRRAHGEGQRMPGHGDRGLARGRPRRSSGRWRRAPSPARPCTAARRAAPPGSAARAAAAVRAADHHARGVDLLDRVGQRQHRYRGRMTGATASLTATARPGAPAGERRRAGRPARSLRGPRRLV